MRLDPPSDPPPPPAMKHVPESGTCWRAPSRAFAQDYWFDDLSTPVPCTQPHTSETVSTVELDEPTAKEAEVFVDWCWQNVHDYIDINLDHWIPWSTLMYLPSRDQVADGASWLRCDAAFPASWGLNNNQVPVDHTARDAATEHADDLRACLDRDPRNVSQPFVDCRQPHQYESTGQLAVLDGLTAYPNAKTLQREARQCRSGLPPGQASAEFEVRALWDPKDSFTGGELVAACFVHRADGAPLR